MWIDAVWNTLIIFLQVLDKRNQIPFTSDSRDIDYTRKIVEREIWKVRTRIIELDNVERNFNLKIVFR